MLASTHCKGDAAVLRGRCTVVERSSKVVQTMPPGDACIGFVTLYINFDVAKFCIYEEVYNPHASNKQGVWDGAPCNHIRNHLQRYIDSIKLLISSF